MYALCIVLTGLIKHKQLYDPKSLLWQEFSDDKQLLDISTILLHNMGP